jgi:hypothetical protein
MATLGLAAVLVGFGGDLSVLIRGLASDGFTVASGLREQLAWFTAALMAGLPLWLFHWWRIQRAVVQADADIDDERRSTVRRIYLYFYLFVATMTVLSSVVFIVAQLVELVVAARRSDGLMTEIGQALAFSIMAVLVWLYHGSILRRENRLLKQQEAVQTKSLLVVVVDADDGRLGRVLVERLHRDVPAVMVQPLGLNPTAAAAMNGGSSEIEPVEILAKAEVIVGPWTLAVPGAAEGQISASIASTVFNNPARKLFIPVRGSEWEWAGVEPWKVATIAKEVSSAVKQMSIGEEVKVARRLSGAAIVVIVLVSLCVILTIFSSLFSLFL